MVRRLLAAAILLLPALACGYIPRDLYAKTLKWADHHGVPRSLAVSLIWVESRYCPQAIGSKGEIGLGQVLPATALSLGIDPRRLYDPDWNLMASMRYLRLQYDRFRSWEKAIAAYNAGPGRAHLPPYTTQVYVRNVLYVAEGLRRQGLKP